MLRSENPPERRVREVRTHRIERGLDFFPFDYESKGVRIYR